MLGAGGDNGQRAQWKLAGHNLNSYLVGAIDLMLGAALIGAVAYRRRRRR